MNVADLALLIELGERVAEQDKDCCFVDTGKLARSKGSSVPVVLILILPLVSMVFPTETVTCIVAEFVVASPVIG